MLRNSTDTGGYEVVISCLDAVQAAQTFIAWLQQSNANERSVSRAKQIITKTNMQHGDAFLAYIHQKETRGNIMYAASSKTGEENDIRFFFLFSKWGKYHPSFFIQGMHTAFLLNYSQHLTRNNTNNQTRSHLAKPTVG
jgi:hypothetical protein